MLCRAVALAMCTMGVGVNARPLSSRPVGTLSEPFWGGDAAETEQLMDIKSGAACACSSKCKTGAPAKCTEALDICTRNVDHLEGVAVLDHNSHYRFSDIIWAQGDRYRYDSVTMLCEPRYRKTLLREVLLKSSHLNGAPLAELCGSAAPSSTACGEAVEAAVAQTAEPHPSQVGWALLEGKRGASGITLSSGDTRMAALSSALATKSRTGECFKAPLNTLVVPVRMGDVLCEDPETGKKPPGIENLVSSAKELIAKLADSGHPVTHVRYSGVMHYGSNEVGGWYERTPTCDVNNRQYVQTLLARSKARGLPGVSLHSEVGADEDLCTLAYSPRVLIHGNSGFPHLVQQLRSGAQQPKAATYTQDGLVTEEQEQESGNMFVAKNVQTGRLQAANETGGDGALKLQGTGMVKEQGEKVPGSTAANATRMERKDHPEESFTDVVISDEHRFIFVDNVKAASTAVRDVLNTSLGVTWATGCGAKYKRCCSKRLRPRTTSACIGPEHKDYFVFGFARHPARKFESGVRQAWFQDRRLRSLSADQILYRQLASNFWLNEHLQPTSYRFSGYHLNMSFVGRTEEMAHSIDRLLDAYCPSIGQAAWSDACPLHILQALRTDVENSRAPVERSMLSDKSLRHFCSSELYGEDAHIYGYVCKECDDKRSLNPMPCGNSRTKESCDEMAL